MEITMQSLIEQVTLVEDLATAKKIIKLLSILFFVLICLLPRIMFADDRLLHISDLTYLGAFRVPAGSGSSNSSYGGETICFNPVNNSLFITGHGSNTLTTVYISEISIPTPKIDTTISNLNTATELQPYADPSEGHYHNIMAGGSAYTNDEIVIGGLLVQDNTLVVSEYAFYDASYRQVLSHYKSGLTLSTSGDFRGMYQVGSNPHPPNPGYISGYMGSIPAAWQSAFGGTHFTGNATISIITRTSMGPSVSSFNVASLGVDNPVTANPLVYYPSDHPTLGAWGDTTTAWPYYSTSDKIRGVFFPEGRRSVLFYGRHGTTSFCYGVGTNNPALNRTPTGGGDIYCYDPVNLNKGNHGYPYIHQMWAYDANDLVSVKNGMKQPWEILPYEAWNLDNVGHWYTISDMDVYGGSAYDPATGKLYISQTSVDTGSRPIIHVFKFPPPPSAPTFLRISLSER